MSTSQPSIDRLSDVLDHWVDAADDQRKVSFRDLMKKLDRRSFGPLLLVPALMAVSPVGAIPGMSVLTATLIILIAGQALFRDSIWLPGRLLEVDFDADRLERAAERARPWVQRIDSLFHPRLEFLVASPAFEVGAVFCILLSMTFYPLAVIPMGVSIPGIAVIAFALGWTTKDGLLILSGLLVATGAVWLLATVVLY